VNQTEELEIECGAPGIAVGTGEPVEAARAGRASIDIEEGRALSSIRPGPLVALPRPSSLIQNLSSPTPARGAACGSTGFLLSSPTLRHPLPPLSLVRRFSHSSESQATRLRSWHSLPWPRPTSLRSKFSRVCTARTQSCRPSGRGPIHTPSALARPEPVPLPSTPRGAASVGGRKGRPEETSSRPRRRSVLLILLLP